MRQALFDEFQQIEWQARVQAIRERLDEQRVQRQEQPLEREEEQEAEREAQEQQAQVDRQAVQIRARMAAGLQWHGDRLLPGEQCESQLLGFRNVVELEGTGEYRYASDYANAALRNAVDVLYMGVYL